MSDARLGVPLPRSNTWSQGGTMAVRAPRDPRIPPGRLRASSIIWRTADVMTVTKIPGIISAVATWRAAATLASAVAVFSLTVSAQGDLRTPWGDPDLQGIWPSGQLMNVPFERPVAVRHARGTDRRGVPALAAASNNSRKRTPKSSAAAAARGVNPPSHWLENGRPSPAGVAHRRSAGRTAAADDRGRCAARQSLAVDQSRRFRTPRRRSSTSTTAASRAA